jgi:hypothetical protein
MSFRPQGRKLSELEAWGMVRKAIRNSIYHSEEEFDKLPKTVQAAVGSHTNLREWAQMDTDTVESVEASHFVRNFRVAQERENEMTALPENIREQLNIAMHGVNGAIQHGSYENAIKKLDCEVPREGKE